MSWRATSCRSALSVRPCSWRAFWNVASSLNRARISATWASMSATGTCPKPKRSISWKRRRSSMRSLSTRRRKATSASPGFGCLRPRAMTRSRSEARMGSSSTTAITRSSSLAGGLAAAPGAAGFAAGAAGLAGAGLAGGVPAAAMPTKRVSRTRAGRSGLVGRIGAHASIGFAHAGIRPQFDLDPRPGADRLPAGGRRGELRAPSRLDRAGARGRGRPPRLPRAVAHRLPPPPPHLARGAAADLAAPRAAGRGGAADDGGRRLRRGERARRAVQHRRPPLRRRAGAPAPQALPADLRHLPGGALLPPRPSPRPRRAPLGADRPADLRGPLAPRARPPPGVGRGAAVDRRLGEPGPDRPRRRPGEPRELGAAHPRHRPFGHLLGGLLQPRRLGGGLVLSRRQPRRAPRRRHRGARPVPRRAPAGRRDRPARRRPPALAPPAARGRARGRRVHVRGAAVTEPLTGLLTLNGALAEKVLTSFIRDAVETAGTAGVVLGLSGGIDSSLAAALAARALGPERVHAFLLPYRTSSPESEAD